LKTKYDASTVSKKEDEEASMFFFWKHVDFLVGPQIG
jgi:hypothetical protein